jgi:hypothetical protein
VRVPKDAPRDVVEKLEASYAENPRANLKDTL